MSPLHRHRSCCLLFFLALPLLCATLSCGGNSPAPSGAEGASVLEQASVPEEASDAAVDDQQRILGRLGYPSAFTLAFVDSGAGSTGKLQRREIWQYHEFLTSFTFIDGRFVRSKAIEPLAQDGVPCPWRPQLFRANMSWLEVEKVLGDRRIVQLQGRDLVDADLAKNLELYCAEQLIIGLSDGKLVFVQALALEPHEPEMMPPLPWPDSESPQTQGFDPSGYIPELQSEVRQ